MKLLIVSGFLGAGKTTLLMKSLPAMVETLHNDNPYKFALIENEVGKVSIDSALLSASGISTQNLIAGCVCCTISAALLDSLDQIQADMNPDWAILETTGIASVAPIVDLVTKNSDIECTTLAVVDASRWARIKVPLKSLLKGQIIGTQYIVINKCDLVDDQQIIDAAAADIHEMEPDANISFASADEGFSPEIIASILG